MDGPTHYRKAENLLAQADHEVSLGAAGKERASQYAAVAQVHATLALAAAKLDVAVVDAAGAALSNVDEWANVMETEPEEPEKKDPKRGVFM